MSESSGEILERLLRANGLGWMVDMYHPRERAVPVLLERLSKVEGEYRRRTGADVSFAPESLSAEAERNRHKVRAFLQALGATGSPEMLAMVWRILQGLAIRELDMSYRDQQEFRLVVTLDRPGNGSAAQEQYQSEDINDAALVRHFGITTIEGRPLFDGFFPLRTKQ